MYWQRPYDKVRAFSYIFVTFVCKKSGGIDIWNIYPNCDWFNGEISLVSENNNKLDVKYIVVAVLGWRLLKNRPKCSIWGDKILL